MKQAARVVILKKDKILFMHRIKQGQEYYVLPGGAVEEGESFEQAAVREAKEETSYDITIKSKLWEIKDEDRIAYFFLAGTFKGRLKLGGPELKLNCPDNQFMLKWIPVNEISNYLIYPDGVKEKLVETFVRK